LQVESRQPGLQSELSQQRNAEGLKFSKTNFLDFQEFEMGGGGEKIFLFKILVF